MCKASIQKKTQKKKYNKFENETKKQNENSISKQAATFGERFLFTYGLDILNTFFLVFSFSVKISIDFLRACEKGSAQAVGLGSTFCIFSILTMHSKAKACTFFQKHTSSKTHSCEKSRAQAVLLACTIRIFWALNLGFRDRSCSLPVPVKKAVLSQWVWAVLLAYCETFEIYICYFHWLPECVWKKQCSVSEFGQYDLPVVFFFILYQMF